MTIHQLKDPCWVLDPSPYGDDDYGDPHYGTEIEAAKGLRELREERADDYPERLAAAMAARVKRDESPCWVAECDADGCNETYNDDEGGASHFPALATLEEWVRSDGWTTAEPDLAYCWNDTPEDAPAPLPSPAELEAAGQLRLPGVA